VSKAAVQLLDIAKHFGKVKALDGLTLEIAPGEFVALLGPSGCGKTTALRALAGLQDLDRGQIIVDGKDITTLAANKRGMGMVFQAYSLFPHMTARDNVEYGLKLKAHKTAADTRKNKSMELLELDGLATHANHYPHQKVLLLDEPLSALDAKVRTQLREEIRRIQLELGTTTLFVTHDQEEALGIADRVGVMRSGVLEQIAAPAELYDRPKTAFVAEFVGLTNQIKVSVSNGSFGVFGSSLNTLPGSVTSGEGTALIRPELITLKSSASGQATVIATSFLGSICRVMATANDGSRITAQMDAQDAAGLTPGAKVEVSVDNIPVFVK